MITVIQFIYLLPSRIRANSYQYTRPPGRQMVPHTRLYFLRKCEMGPKWSWLCRRMGIRDLLHCIHYRLI